MGAAQLHSTEEPTGPLPCGGAPQQAAPTLPLAALRSADLGTRRTGMATLGRTVGNGALQRLAAATPHLQREDGEELSSGGDTMGSPEPIALGGGPAGGVKTTRGTVSTYAVTGTLGQAATQIGARTEAGKCWVDGGEVSMNDDGAGKVASVSGSPVINVELPAWDGLAAAPQVQQTEWNRFMTALKAHEEKHATIFEAAFASYNGTVGKSTAEFDKIQPKMEADEATFDTDTDHGKTPAPGTKLQSNLGEMEKVK